MVNQSHQRGAVLIQCTVHSTQYTVHSTQYTVYTVHSIHSAQYTVHSAQQYTHLIQMLISFFVSFCLLPRCLLFVTFFRRYYENLCTQY